VKRALLTGYTVIVANEHRKKHALLEARKQLGINFTGKLEDRITVITVHEFINQRLLGESLDKRKLLIDDLSEFLSNCFFQYEIVGASDYFGEVFDFDN